ncbi:cytochrome-c peroxidase [Taibaiella koreensis]|uniref:cytochrome-c peroxidase n=1 Tax=Taibaiella koreensis TaxID=1268548 RepID=UPI000E59FE5D|nr:cytochrome c peroxidase [Taibaiella koreensis]
MNRKITLFALIALSAVFLFSFNNSSPTNAYTLTYYRYVNALTAGEEALQELIRHSDLDKEADVRQIGAAIQLCRSRMKAADFWLRYLEPISYKKINGPLPVEWETEVFEKFEKPYKRDGAGLTLAAQYLEETDKNKDILARLVAEAIAIMPVYGADSITRNLRDHHHFFLCNRLFLLNLAALYTTGFECPDTAAIIPELGTMLEATDSIYLAFNESYPATPLTDEYLRLYRDLKAFVHRQPRSYSVFDHFTFIRDYVNPLYRLSQQMILRYRVASRSMVDYSLNKAAASIFDKAVYNGSNAKGLFLRVKDTAVLNEIDRVGKLLFYDPILSGNNLRSCASCHKPTEYFADGQGQANLQFNRKELLPRNTPSLINAPFNHLLMLDGSHITLQNQTLAVMTNPLEMGSDEQKILEKVLSCADYKKAFTRLLAYTPQEPEITLEHISSAITMYYSKFSRYYAPFDEAMDGGKALPADAIAGFNLFMSKAQCATCHFVPQFNGVKPPFVSSEFEVLGVPADTAYRQLSPDPGRYKVNPAKETLNAFRTGSIRNATHTAPYMHNGIFRTMKEVVDFYDAGGGAGKGLQVGNQTLSSDQLHLSPQEKENLIAFIKSLDEQVVFEAPPAKLPRSRNPALNRRKVGGEY